MKKKATVTKETNGTRVNLTREVPFASLASVKEFNIPKARPRPYDGFDDFDSTEREINTIALDVKRDRRGMRALGVLVTIMN